MARQSGEAKALYISPAMLSQIEADLTQLSQLEPGAKPVKEAIEALMPVIRGCRARGHSWNRIAQSFQKQVDGVSSALLRKYAYEFDPELKGPVKGLIPSLPENKVQGARKAKPVAKSTTDKPTKAATTQAAVNF